MIKIDSHTFKKELSAMMPVLSTKNTMPILRCVKIDVSDGLMHLTASSSAIVHTNTLRCEAEANYALCVDLKMLFDIVKNMSGVVMLSFNEKTLTIDSAVASYSMQIDRYDMYPAISEVSMSHRFDIEAEELKTGISLVEDCIEPNNIRAVLDSICLNVFDGVEIAAFKLEGLAVYAAEARNVTDVCSLVIPRDAISVIKALSGSIKVSSNNNNVYFETSTSTVRCRLLDDVYPAYSILLEKNVSPTCSVVVPKDGFCSSLSSIRSVMYSGDVPVEFSTTNCSLKLDDNAFGIKGEEAVAFDKKGEDIAIKFNASLMYKIVSKYSGEITIDFHGHDKPMYFGYGTNLKCLLAAMV